MQKVSFRLLNVFNISIAELDIRMKPAHTRKIKTKKKKKKKSQRVTRLNLFVEDNWLVYRPSNVFFTGSLLANQQSALWIFQQFF